MFADIKEFHKKFGLEYDGPPRLLPEELQDFRRRFLDEELTEYFTATYWARDALGHALAHRDIAEHHHQLEKAFDGLVDLVYVALGTAYLHGFDFEEGWRRVHEANMKKVRVERPEDSKRGSTFDVVKPEGWEPPSLIDLVETGLA